MYKVGTHIPRMNYSTNIHDARECSKKQRCRERCINIVVDDGCDLCVEYAPSDIDQRHFLAAAATRLRKTGLVTGRLTT